MSKQPNRLGVTLWGIFGEGPWGVGGVVFVIVLLAFLAH
jgi:hypothetical protein